MKFELEEQNTKKRGENMARTNNLINKSIDRCGSYICIIYCILQYMYNICIYILHTEWDSHWL